jgi:hypothetical protein
VRERDTGDDSTAVEAIDPAVMKTRADTLADVSVDARQRLEAALASLPA